MIALRIKFLAGRFHANPWDRGTNDGDVEWPPSPWRLLRAITSCWYRAGRPDRATFLSVLDALAESPFFELPRATSGHTRHYMPLGARKDGKAETTLVLDSFVALERGRDTRPSAYVIWPNGQFSADQRTLLDQCCEFVGYLGRAESWCSMNLAESIESDGSRERVVPASDTRRDGPIVRRLAPGPALRGEALLNSLSETTGQMRKARRLMPIGATWVEYQLPSDFLMVREQYDRAERTRAVFGPTVLRFALERGQRSPKPSIKDALVFAELLRAAAIKQFSDREGQPAALRLAGKAEDGSARTGHDHPYFLPFDSEGRGEIDGLDVWFPSGCTHAEYVAVTSVATLREHVIYGDDFPITFIGSVQRECSAAWRSATPLLLNRFPKIRGSNGSRRIVDAPEKQVAEMVRQASDQLAEVELWPPGRGIEKRCGGYLRIDAFRRTRIRKPSLPLPVVAATLRFEKPVQGPIVLGRLAHFGLGRFEPADARDTSA